MVSYKVICMAAVGFRVYCFGRAAVSESYSLPEPAFVSYGSTDLYIIFFNSLEYNIIILISNKSKKILLMFLEDEIGKL